MAYTQSWYLPMSAAAEPGWPIPILALGHASLAWPTSVSALMSGLSQTEAGSFIQVSHVLAGAQLLGHLLLFLPGH